MSLQPYRSSPVFDENTPRRATGRAQHQGRRVGVIRVLEGQLHYTVPIRPPNTS